MNESYTPAFVKETRDEFENFGGTLKVFCEHKNLNYTRTSRKIAELEKEESEGHIARAKKKIARLTPLAADKLSELLKSSDEEVQIRAAIEILKRAGIGERGALIEVTQNNTQNNLTVIPVNITLPDNGRMIQVAATGEPSEND